MTSTTNRVLEAEIERSNEAIEAYREERDWLDDRLEIAEAALVDIERGLGAHLAPIFDPLRGRAREALHALFPHRGYMERNK